MQRPGRLLRADVDAPRGQHGARVQSRLHAHDADAGSAVAGQDGALNGRRAAPARQQGRMDVEASEPRYRERLRRQDQAIGDHHPGIDVQAAQQLERRGDLKLAG